MKSYRLLRKKKIVLLGFVLFAYLLIVTLLVFVNGSNHQDIRGHAQVSPDSEIATTDTPQSALAQCTASGTAQIGVSYTNTNLNEPITVTATNHATNVSIDLGTVLPGETKTEVISTNSSVVTAGSVQFTVTKSGNSTQQSANYTARSCQPFSNETVPAVVSPTPTSSQNTCGNVTTDTVMLTDTSGSMGQNNKLVEAKNAGNNFIDVVSQQATTNRVGLVNFATTATLDSSLTTNYSAVKSKMSSLSANGSTCLECGIHKATADIQANGRPHVKKVIVLLTDGIANTVEGNTKQVSTGIAEQKALEAAMASHNTYGTVFFVIGFGSDVNKPFLQNLATKTGGKFYFPLPTELDGVYQEISQLIGKGVIGGFFFNDANVNGQYDQGEQKLPNWSVKLTSAATTKTATTDSAGQYSFIGVCDGTYKVSEVAQSGWRQTVPTDLTGYSVTIANANQFTDKNFGNTDKSRCSDGIDNDNNGFTDSKDSTCHTDGNPNNPVSYDPKKDGERGGNTCADSKDNNGNGLIDGADPVCHTDGDPKKPWDPNLPEMDPQTKVSVTVLLDGIGSRGDNTNPVGTLSNKNPLHPSLPSNLAIYDLHNKLIASGAATITYASSSGVFTGTITFVHFPSGQYYLKVGTSKYLTKLLPEVQAITAGQTNKISSVALVAGDMNVDNRIDILDYNRLLDCYSDISVAVNCAQPGKKVTSDINDDGLTNSTDYNLFLREITSQPGS